MNVFVANCARSLCATLCRGLPAVCCLTVFCLVAGLSGLAYASIKVDLLNHRAGSAAPPYYGLRIDNANGVNTFSFEDDGSGNDTQGVAANSTVEMEVFGGPTGTSNTDGHVTISGSVIHNQSDQKWGIDAVLRIHELTNDADLTNWFTSNDLYDAVLHDLLGNGNNVNPLGENHLKDNTKPADKIVFDLVELTLTFMGIAPQAFTLPGQDDTIDLLDYPDGGDGTNDNDPFVIVNGHRLGGDDGLVGLGWLIPKDATTRGYTQDFLFEIALPLNPPPPVVPEPVSLVVWGLLLAVGAVSAVRCDR